jgi:hypothetical protein
MAAGTLNITIEQGATWGLSLNISTCTSKFNLTNCTLRSHIRRNFDFKFLTVITTEILDAVNGVVKLSLTDEQTILLDDSPASWDLFLTDDNGNSYKLITGNATIIRANTR